MSVAVVEPGWSCNSNVNPKACFQFPYGILCTATDCSSNVCSVLIERGDYIELLIKIITDPRYRDDSGQEDFVSLCISIIHNISKLPESRQQFEKEKAVDALKHYLGYNSEKIQISSLSAIACLLSDSEDSTALIDENCN